LLFLCFAGKITLTGCLNFAIHIIRRHCAAISLFLGQLLLFILHCSMFLWSTITATEDQNFQNYKSRIQDQKRVLLSNRKDIWTQIKQLALLTKKVIYLNKNCSIQGMIYFHDFFISVIWFTWACWHPFSLSSLEWAWPMTFLLHKHFSWKDERCLWVHGKQHNLVIAPPH